MQPALALIYRLFVASPVTRVMYTPEIHPFEALSFGVLIGVIWACTITIAHTTWNVIDMLILHWNINTEKESLLIIIYFYSVLRGRGYLSQLFTVTISSTTHSGDLTGNSVMDPVTPSLPHIYLGPASLYVYHFTQRPFVEMIEHTTNLPLVLVSL